MVLAIPRMDATNTVMSSIMTTSRAVNGAGVATVGRSTNQKVPLFLHQVICLSFVFGVFLGWEWSRCGCRGSVLNCGWW